METAFRAKRRIIAPTSSRRKGGLFLGPQYPRGPICRKFTREWGAVPARHTQGLRSPFPLHQSKVRKQPGGTAGPHFCRAKWKSPPDRRTFAEKSPFAHRAAGLFQSKVGKSLRPPGWWTFAGQSAKVCPARAFFRRAFFPAFFFRGPVFCPKKAASL